MADCISPQAASDFANKDVNRIVGKIAEVLARKSPYMDILDGGTLPNVSDVVRSIVSEPASLGTSLATPTFINDIDLCGAQSNQDNVGSTEYTYQLESLLGKGPKVCVKTSRTAFKGSYLAAQHTMEKGILQIMNADIRNVLRAKSGLKFVVNTNYGFNTNLTGSEQAINTLFFNVLPNAPLSHKIVRRLARYLREEMRLDPYTLNGMGEMFKFIGSPDIIERFRNELDVKEDIRALTTGQYKLGERSIAGYQFEGPYRGIGLAPDSQPLRFNTMTNGVPNFIEPEISVAATRGVASRINPAWSAALYEIAFLIAPNSFVRLVPEQYTGEGTFKFNPQLSMGELNWHYVIDNDCNERGMFGWHLYQISRAFQPIRPHAVIPIAYARCGEDYGTSECNSASAGL